MKVARHHMHFTNHELDKRAIWCSWHQLFETSAKIKDYSNSNPIEKLAVKLAFFSPEARLKRETPNILNRLEIKFSKYKIIVDE